MRAAENGRDLRWAGALVWAALVHAGVVALLLGGGGDRSGAALDRPAQADAQPILAFSEVATVQLIDSDTLPASRGGLVLALPGTGDVGRTGTASHALPNADRNLPGTRAAGLGGGAAGGADTWTGRRDKGNVRQQVWNDAKTYRLARQRTGNHRRSNESITRAPTHGFGARFAAQKLARRGARHAHAGAKAEAGAAATAQITADKPRWDDADPLLNLAPARRVEVAQAGTTRVTKSSPLIDRGARATDATRRGRTVDDVTTAAASNETNPMPMDLLQAQSGGNAVGVAGRRRGIGVSAVGVRGSRGSGATTAAAMRGATGISVRARRQLPYFRSMYRRVEGQIRFPEQLALAMAQGRLVARFTLLANGDIRGFTITKTSGYAAFDTELSRAFKRAAPFGKVPKSILRGRGSITVVAPFEFRNPLIR